MDLQKNQVIEAEFTVSLEAYATKCNARRLEMGLSPLAHRKWFESWSFQTRHSYRLWKQHPARTPYIRTVEKDAYGNEVISFRRMTAAEARSYIRYVNQ